MRGRSVRAKGERAARGAAAAAALAAALAATGCNSTVGGGEGAEPAVRFRFLTASDEAPPPPARILNPELRAVARIERIELGRMHQARLLTAVGEAPVTGWFQPALAPRAGGRPGPDGFLEFDLVAAPPELNNVAPGPVGTPAQRAVRADRILPDALVRSAVGVRVFAESGPPAALRFDGG